MAARLYAMLPRIRITDLFSEVARWTLFTDCFTHLRSGETVVDPRVLMASLLADGLNLSLTRMAEACTIASLGKLAKSRRLYAFGKASAYPTLEPLIAGRVNVALIRAHWAEILRVAASIRTGTVILADHAPGFLSAAERCRGGAPRVGPARATASRDEALEIGIDRDRHGAALFQLLQGLAGNEALFEGAVAPAAHDPDIAGTQSIAQFRQHTQLVVAPVDGPPASTCRAHRSRMKPVGADFCKLSVVAVFMSRSISMARSSDAAAGTPWKANVARKAGDQRRTQA